MIDTDNKNQLTIVGYSQATITQEFKWWIGQEFDNVNIVSPDKLVPDADTAYIVSITKDRVERQQVIDLLKNYSLATFIHSSVIMHGESKVMPGTCVLPNVGIFFNAVVGSHCIIAPYSMIGHSTTVGDNNIINPGTMIAGSCNIGDHCLFGIRSTIIDKLNICSDVTIGAGSLVTKHIETPGTYVGSPARRVP
jgi:sugar O-acyltransferase (sialic acid O-acetyltransferase NeuD family)